MCMEGTVMYNPQAQDQFLGTLVGTDEEIVKIDHASFNSKPIVDPFIQFSFCLVVHSAEEDCKQGRG